MDEFEFLDRQFSRLREIRSLRHHDEQKIKAQHTGKKPAPFSAYETAELMMTATLRDYLVLKNEKVGAT